jgi:riboflavin biosynthesis pyrimidine reductase
MSVVFVQSVDGNTEVDDPSALGGGETDKHVIYEGLSRVSADAVMAGANSVRHGTVVFSVWHPELVALRRTFGKPRHPVQIVVTSSGADRGWAAI